MVPQSELREIRQHSLLEAKKLGYPINHNLPLLDAKGELRSVEELTGRILCLTAIVASAWGYPRSKSITWIKQECLVDSLTESEISFLEDNGETIDFRLRVEALWALIWCAALAHELDFAVVCNENMVALLPDLRVNENSISFRNRVNRRDLKSILARCDLSYCLHWAIRDSALQGKRPPGFLHPVRVVERRHALEWMIGNEDWDNVSMDT